MTHTPGTPQKQMDVFCRPRAGEEFYAEKFQTMIVLDWDDTPRARRTRAAAKRTFKGKPHIFVGARIQ